MIGKGTIAAITENGCRINKAMESGTVTRTFRISVNINKDSLSLGQEVAYVEFEDNTGIIFAVF